MLSNEPPVPFGGEYSDYELKLLNGIEHGVLALSQALKWINSIDEDAFEASGSSFELVERCKGVLSTALNLYDVSMMLDEAEGKLARSIDLVEEREFSKEELRFSAMEDRL